MKVADKSIRLVNFMIDTAVLIAAILLLIYLIHFFHPEITNDDSLFFEFVYFGTFISYYFFFEAFTGKTVGKILTKTIVVNRKGNKPSPVNIFIRTLIRLIPIEGISFLFGNSGLHDLISKTIVISDKKNHIQ